MALLSISKNQTRSHRRNERIVEERVMITQIDALGHVAINP